MAFTFNGNIPGAIKFNGNDVKKLIYNGVAVWVRDITVVYEKACAGQKIETDPTFTLTATSTSLAYGSGTYRYTLKIPYQKTTSSAFNNQAYLTPTLKNSSGGTVKTWERRLLNATSGVDVRYVTLTWTSDTWLGEEDSYVLSIASSGYNGDLVRYPSGYNITLTATNA